MKPWHAFSLLLAAVISVPLFSQTGSVDDPDRYLHDWTYSHFGSRHFQYDTHTGELLIVGEIAHGMDYYASAGEFWWCGFGGENSSPILSFLMREATVEHHDRPRYYPPGLEAPYTDRHQYSVIRLEPLQSQETFVSVASGGTDYPGDYRMIPTDNLEFFLYQAHSGGFNIAVMHDGIQQELLPGEGLGDESANRDNGVRNHVAFRAHIPLPEEKLKVTGFLDQFSAPYDTEHIPGL